MNYINILIILWNIFVFLVYGIDKFRAKHSMWRISEAFLCVSAFLFASVGAMLGMIVFNHKTSKVKFRILIPLAFIFNIASALLVKLKN